MESREKIKLQFRNVTARSTLHDISKVMRVSDINSIIQYIKTLPEWQTLNGQLEILKSLYSNFNHSFVADVAEMLSPMSEVAPFLNEWLVFTGRTVSSATNCNKYYTIILGSMDAAMRNERLSELQNDEIPSDAYDFAIKCGKYTIIQELLRRGFT
jgi:hypothetical protein